MGKIATEQEAYNIGKRGIPRINEPCTKARARELGCAIKPGYSYAGNEPVELEALYRNERAALAWNTIKFYYTHRIEKASDPLEIKVPRAELIHDIEITEGFFAGVYVNVVGYCEFDENAFFLNGNIWQNVVFKELVYKHYPSGQQYVPFTNDLWEFEGNYFDEEDWDHRYTDAEFRLPDVTVPGSEFEWNYVFRFVVHISTRSTSDVVGATSYILYNRYSSGDRLPSPTDYYWRPLSGLAGLEFTECEEPKPDFFD